MVIKADFRMEDISEILENWSASIVNAAVKAMGFLGAKCVNYARTIPDPAHGGNGFQDQTGNLRSSIGFKIFVGGSPVAEDYHRAKNGDEGIVNGKALADEVGATCGSNQIMLVVTAGMEYAVYVESLGRDVIASSELLAERECPRMKEKIDEIFRW